MKTALTQDLLKSRRKEVMGYLRFLERALATQAKLESPGLEPLPLELELTHTLKANTYLLLYNTVEAVMGQLVTEIHEDIKACGLGVDDLTTPLYVEVIRALKRGEENITDIFAHPSGQSMVAYWLRNYEKKVLVNRNPLFSGNIDGRLILSIGEMYGFTTEFAANRAKLTHPALQKTKNHRNTLAHGERSFTDLGRGFSYSQVRDDAVAALRTLVRVRIEVDSYLTVQGYKRTT